MKFSFKKRNNLNLNNNKKQQQSLPSPSADKEFNSELSKLKEIEIQSNKDAIKSNTNNKDKDIGQSLREEIDVKNENNNITIQPLKTDEEPKKDYNVDSETEIDKCIRCEEILTEDSRKPNWKWNLNNNRKLCLKCYTIKEKEYEKLINFCAICDSKLKFLRYNPKPEWKIIGQLCRKCWDIQNAKYKSQNLEK